MARPDKTGRSRLGELWRDLRLGAHLDQRALAAALGCSATHISNIEHGRRIPSFELLVRFDELARSEGILRSQWEWAMAERAGERAGIPARRQGRTLPGDRAQFVRDIAPRGEPVFEPHRQFTAGWEIRNAGTATWENRFLEAMGPRTPFYGAIALDARTPVPFARPGDTVAIRVRMRAPELPGDTITYFQMVHADGSLCFPDRYASGVYVRIQVREPIQVRG